MIAVAIRKVAVPIMLIVFSSGSVVPLAAADGIMAQNRSVREKMHILYLIKSISGQFGIDPFLVEAVVKVESDYDPLAISSAGAEGLMQIVPQTQNELGLTDPFNPKDNLRAGVRYLVKLIARLHDVRSALLAYHCGVGRIESGRVPNASKRYADRVLRIYWALRRARRGN